MKRESPREKKRARLGTRQRNTPRRKQDERAGGEIPVSGASMTLTGPLPPEEDASEAQPASQNQGKHQDRGRPEPQESVSAAKPDGDTFSAQASDPAMNTNDARSGESRTVHIPIGSVSLVGDMSVPQGATGMVLFAHGSGSSRFSPRNRYVAQVLREGGLATLLVDLLTAEEEMIDRQTLEFRFNIGLLAERLVGITDWQGQHRDLQHLKIGYFGASTGSAAALIAAARRADRVRAIVSRGGRPDLAAPSLPHVKAPTLLIVGGEDFPVIGLNQQAYESLRTEKKLEIIPGATHLFEEPGALEEVARLAREWFVKYLTTSTEEG